MTQQQCQLTNSRISTLQLRNKQTNRHRSVSYIHSCVLRPSDVINDFVFKDKDLQPKAKDFVIKDKSSTTYHCLGLKSSHLSSCSLTKIETVKFTNWKILGNNCNLPTEMFACTQKFFCP